MKAKIYSTNWCSWCSKAKELLLSHRIEVEEILLNSDEAIAEFKKDCPGFTSVPQIFIDNKFIGGYSELATFIENL